jgi:hypothetical protein
MSAAAETRLSGHGRAGAAVLAGSACVGLASFIYYYSRGLTTAHYDAKAHLVVARRVFDALSPGYEQMGAHWLPLLHLLYLPFVMFESQYQTALLPSLLSVAAFALSGWLVYRIAVRCTGSAEAGIFAAVILVANANLEYLQSCPLTEPISILLLLLTTDALIAWRDSGAGSLPWWPAVWASLGALCRYEGWYFFGGIVLLLACDWFAGRTTAKRALRAALVFGIVFALPIVAHFGFIYLRLGDTFIQRVVRGTPDPYLTYKRPALSTLYHLAELVQITAFVPLLVAASGMWVALRRRDRLAQRLPLFLLWLPSLTNISALYWGLIYRVRYSVLLIPAVAVFSGLLASEPARRPVFIVGCAVAMALPVVGSFLSPDWQYQMFAPGPGSMALPALSLLWLLWAAAQNRYRWPLLALCAFALQFPALRGETRPILDETMEHEFIEPERAVVLRYLQAHYDGSRILIDMGKLAPLAYDSGFPLKDMVYNEGESQHWHAALECPETQVGWLCAQKGDAVWEWLQVDPGKAARYALALRTENFRLYRLNRTGKGDLLPSGLSP